MAPDTRIMAPKMMDTTFQKPKKFAARTMMSTMAKGMRKPMTSFPFTNPSSSFFCWNIVQVNGLVPQCQ